MSNIGFALYVLLMTFVNIFLMWSYLDFPQGKWVTIIVANVSFSVLVLLFAAFNYWLFLKNKRK
ncbi:hypothetical protein XBP1_1650002 [Xenorhabdus bovienii str. puntauvense]|uniref:Uncharacterized protein n=1 Tax=Xenorhabdus bovienii str. puntauvense TaxID=1398201 RepID=A0A077NCA8_XENBV|nr:hypothetical protein XBP1_1650002 [Xenorhabdus bovienii str. puntauvense]